MAPRDFVFAHFADAHVGAWPRDPAVRAALRESVLAALRTVTERSADFLVISGDLFHTPVPDPDEVAPIAAALRDLADRGVRVYVIFGSHDYVAHRTSWLDVLAETGLFVRVAPEAVRSGEERWKLPFLIDAPTGAVIAGISGRSHGLDREYYRSMDPSDYVRTPGFHVFMFHAAVQEYLPPGLQAHVRGVSRADLPPDADYYAGGHIHASYTGLGPSGGLLVNPGAVFGTSLPDIVQGAAGRSHRGLVVVTVRSGVPSLEFVETLRPGSVDVFDVDLSGKSADEARTDGPRRGAGPLRSRGAPLPASDGRERCDAGRGTWPPRFQFRCRRSGRCERPLGCGGPRPRHERSGRGARDRDPARGPRAGDTRELDATPSSGPFPRGSLAADS